MTLREFFQLTGKRENKVAAVFGTTPEGCARAVAYLRHELPDIPVWLFSTCLAPADVAAQCERVCVEPGAMALHVTAQKELWPLRVVLAAATWTGERGRWPVKLAPFLIPPFRALLMNEHGDFFAGSVAAVRRHAARRMRDALHSGWHRLRDVARGLWLFVFAWIAQWFSPLSRWAFRRSHGSQTLSLSVQMGEGQNIALFHHHPRKWDRDALERLLRGSEARFLLVLESADEVGVDAWLPLFGDPLTFAVSRQASYRDWKPELFPTAPFRQLQPGECARTLAPVSTAILVDRAKLLALGIPATVVTGAAWYLLFWKAAAAGWRSYSVGGERPLLETADWPYEEAEFVGKVLGNAEWKALGPSDPQLARGNVAFSLAHVASRGSVGKPSVMLVSPYLPYPLSHGGAVRIYNLCRALRDQADFVLISFREKEDVVNYEKLHEVFREVYVVDRDEKASRDETLPRQVREHVSQTMRAFIADMARRRRPDVLQVEFTHLAAFREAAPDLPAVLVEHDLTFSLYRQLAQRAGSDAARREHERWLAFERGWLQRYDAVWTMSEQDRAEAVAQGSPAQRTYTIANGVDIARFLPQQEASPAPEVFYVGSFRHLPNIIGFRRLLEEIMPQVWKQHPEAVLRGVAGPDHQRYWREFMKRDYPENWDSRVVVHGFVEDLRPLYAKASIVAVPLEVSAGTNIKVMEAMACGKAVVSPPVGCAGLELRDGCDAVIRDATDAFAAAITGLLEDSALRGRIAHSARATVERRFSWEVIAQSALESYHQVMKQ